MFVEENQFHGHYLCKIEKRDRFQRNPDLILPTADIANRAMGCIQSPLTGISRAPNLYCCLAGLLHMP